METIKTFTIITILLASLTTIQSKDLIQRNTRDVKLDPCDNSNFSDDDKLQCYCKTGFEDETISFIVSAECMIMKTDIPSDDEVWESLGSVRTLERLQISSKSDTKLTYVPTKALKNLGNLLSVNIKFENIGAIEPYAFANLSFVQELKLAGNAIKTLSMNAFAHHPNLTSITLDSNNIIEIKRHVFKGLPELQQLFLTNNNISMIHDRAFLHLGSLRELELEKNSIFVLTNETFLGLVNLTRLELGYNNLQVIGDNTFSHLRNLRSLNLDHNKIKIVDDKAFQGATNLQSLSLAKNKLKELKNPKIFSGLDQLMYLNLESNGMHLLAAEVIAPIMRNFYSDGSSIGFNDNKFPCDCKLNWFISLKNHTKNGRLQTAIENLMCYPSPKLAEDFKNLLENETDKSAAETQNQGESDYEYYDDSSMEGRLFFCDIPENLIPCTNGPITTSDTTIYNTPRIIPKTFEPKYSPIPETTTIKQTTHFIPRTEATTRRTTILYTKGLHTHYPENSAKRLKTIDNFDSSETIVKDAFEPIPTFGLETSVKPTIQFSNKEISTHAPPRVKYDESKNDVTKNKEVVREQESDIEYDKFLQTAGTDSAPESMSHVHTSKAAVSSMAKSAFFVSCILMIKCYDFINYFVGI